VTLRVGIVSAAWGAFAHLPAWRAIPGVEVTAICTSRRETAEAAQARLGLPRAFWNAEEMCADPDIDIVDLGTRPNVRLPMVLAALANDKHIYNASPHVPDWASARQVDAAWRSSRSVGVVDAFSEWVPALRQMQVMLDDGYIGTPLGGTCHFNISLFNQPNKQFPYNWFWEKGLGVSAVRNNGSHGLYLLRRLFGEIEELVADDRQILKEWLFPDGDRIVPQTNDFADALLRFASGLTLSFQTSWSMTMHDGFLLDVFGEKGRLVAKSPTFPTARECTLQGGALEDIAFPDRFRHVEEIGIDWQHAIQPSFPMALSMNAMVAQIQGRAEAASPTFADALEIERLQEAIRLSSEGRRWVKVAEVS
jgi:predicted dehydrogenase